MMKRDEIASGLRRQRVETGSIACLGCGWENSCGVHGCRILREAADMLENDETCDGVLLKQNGELRDAAAQVTRLAAEAAAERDWISVEDRLPEPMTWVLCACRDGQMRILRYDNIMDDWDLMIRNTCYRREHVKYWMPLPEPPKEEK